MSYFVHYLAGCPENFNNKNLLTHTDAVQGWAYPHIFYFTFEFDVTKWHSFKRVCYVKGGPNH